MPFFCQESLQGRWKLEVGSSSTDLFKTKPAFNLRYVSPLFKYNTVDWTEEMEKHPEKYKRARFAFELVYARPIRIFCSAANIQYRLLKFKRLTLEAYFGLKFIFVAPLDYIPNKSLAEAIDKSGWYGNVGLIIQMDLGFISPFADAGYDGMFTFGTEIDFQPVYKKLKKKFRQPYMKEG